jgi:hypothetical protein
MIPAMEYALLADASLGAVIAVIAIVLAAVGLVAFLVHALTTAAVSGRS